MTTLYLVRHVQAEANLRREFHGQTDGQVTELGIRQAERLGERFAGVSIDAMLASTLTRAAFTAKTIVQKHPHTPLGFTPALREIYAGAWEGHTLAYIEETYPEEYNGFLQMNPETRLGGGESIEECACRLDKAIRRFVSAHEGETLLVVSHGCALTALLSKYHGSPVSLGPNATVSRVDFDGDDCPRIVYMGDKSHLDGVESPAHLNLQVGGTFGV